DRSEIAMLKSINRSQYCSSSSINRMTSTGRLSRHEFYDSSPEEMDSPSSIQSPSTGLPPTQKRSVSRKQSDQQQMERDSNRIRSTSAVTTRDEMIKLEGRWDGWKRGKKSTTITPRSQQTSQFTQEHLQKLIYDTDFDCYYDPVNDRYYKITPM
ncbi:hypothetical protein PFISCL1PPCAC_15649, partial [Pristionchus fissidentatus]